MDVSSLTVEVRDKTLARVGVIRPEELDLELDDLFNNIGTWSLTLPVEHRLAGALSTPGAGIVVTGAYDVLMSGPMITPLTELKTSDPRGTVTFSGVSDSVVLGDMLCFPDPTNVDPTTQTLSHDVRTGSTEAVMHGYVNANCGPGAPALRRKAGLIMGYNGSRGPSITANARFQVLGTMLEQLALSAGLGFRVVQRGNYLVFETFAIQDRSPFIRLSVLNGNLTSQKVAISAPGCTQIIVAGQGEEEDRTFVLGNNSDSLQAETDWGRRIERFVDQRQTDDPTVYAQKISDELAKDGYTGVSVQMVPTDDTTMVYLRDYQLGDKVAVVLDTIERKSTVTGYVLKADSSGTRFGVVLGDPGDFDESGNTAGRLSDMDKRVMYLETAGSVPKSSVDATTVLNLMGVF